MKDLHPVYKLLLKIPKGKVTTYGAIGKTLGLNPRHVGRILHVNKGAPKIPCHRVVKSDGSIADGYAFGGPGMQRKMLEREGVIFKNNKVDSIYILH
jgi:methylated-DNA-protein-cysteine methyltransferase related protein